ncbi:MAG: VWA domain-containing protein [Planctomycetota bacterium]
MIFLAPLLGLIAGAISVPTLIAFYLLRLRRRPVRVSTTMFWLPAGLDVEANVPLRMIRASWLLLLHLLILGALLMAVARPALPGGAPADTVFVVLDQTASMATTDTPDGRTRLEHAKDNAVEFLEGLGRQGFPGRVAVIGVASDARLLSLPDPSVGRAISAVRGTEPTDQPGSIASAGTILEGYAQRGVADESEEQPALAARFFGDGAEPPPEIAGVEISSAPAPPTDGEPNLGIVALAANRDRAEPAVIRVFCRLAWSGDVETDTVVEVRRDGPEGERIDARALSVSSETASASAGFEVREPDAVVLHVSVTRGGSLASDDTAAITIPAVDPPRIHLVHAPGPTDWILETILRESRPELLRVFEPPYSAQQAVPADLIVFDGVIPPEGITSPTLVFGAPPPVGGLTLTIESESGSPATWDRAHPVMREVGVGSLRVSGVSAFDLSGATVRTVELMRGDLGPWAVLVRTTGTEHIAVSFPLVDSNWPLTVSLPIFVANAIERLTGTGPSAGTVYRTDEPIDLDAIGASGVTGPGLRAVASAGRFVGPATRVGLHTAEPTNAAVPIALLDQNESLIARSTGPRDQRIERAGAGGAPRELWRWFVLLAAVLLGIEWIVYGLKSRA